VAPHVQFQRLNPAGIEALHPGILFEIIPESRSPCPGFPTLFLRWNHGANIGVLQGQSHVLKAEMPHRFIVGEVALVIQFHAALELESPCILVYNDSRMEVS
jgi:hypothetical protein